MKKLSLAAAALATSLALTGCSFSKGQRPVSQDERDKMVKFSQCMKGYGINIPGPDEAGGPVQTFNPNDPKAQAAQAACRKYAPNPQQQGKLTAEQEDRALKLAECLRKQGISAKDPEPGNSPWTSASAR